MSTHGVKLLKGYGYHGRLGLITYLIVPDFVFSSL